MLRMQSATPAATPQPPVLPGPSFLDYFLIFCGAGLSVLLAQLSGLHVDHENARGLLLHLHSVLPQMLFLPMGIVLFWPIFFGVQKVLGRNTGMTLGEWLWGVAWLANVFFAIWFFWYGFGGMPSAVQNIKQQVIISYLLFSLAMAVIAPVLLIVGLVRRAPLPWTHRFCLAMLTWPIAPLVIVYLGQVKFTE